MSKHEIVFPCGCIITIFQFDAEQPRIEKEPCKKHREVAGSKLAAAQILPNGKVQNRGS